jgi:hypothetical protein
MKVALLYFGKSRSIGYTYKSHHKHIFQVLEKYGFKYDVYIHTWKTEDNVVWNKDTKIPEKDEYHLLNPKVLKIDEQKGFLDSLDFSIYFSEETFKKYGQQETSEWCPKLLKNHLCAVESQKRCFNMISEEYDIYIVLRPDAYFLKNIEVEQLQNIKEGVLYVPCWASNEGYNDRFALGKKDIIKKYTHRIDDYPGFRSIFGRLVSEKCVRLFAEKYKIPVEKISVLFSLIRPDGSKDDREVLNDYVKYLEEYVKVLEIKMNNLYIKNLNVV